MTQSIVEAQSTKRVRSQLMRAVRIVEPLRSAIEDVPIPQPAAGQVLFRVEGCGICASNLPLWQGRPWFQYPMLAGAPGHEAWGVVEAIGEGVEEIHEGQRIAALSNNGYAEFDLADANAVIPLPAALDGVPFPAEPIACAINVFRRSEIRAGQTVAILGIGFLGAMLTQMAVRAGARVIAISRRPYSLAIAEKHGAEHKIILDDHWRIIEEVRDLTGGEFCDRVIEAVGEQWPLDLAGELTRVRGRLVVAGYHQESPRQVNMQLWNWRGLDVINAHERDPKIYREGMQMAVQAVSDGSLDVSSLLTHQFALADLDRGLNAVIERPEGLLKAWVTP